MLFKSPQSGPMKMVAGTATTAWVQSLLSWKALGKSYKTKKQWLTLKQKKAKKEGSSKYDAQAKCTP